jgi:xanthine dehydrogenase large subunit
MTYSPLALLARGEARFTGDLPLPPGTLHAMVATSPQAHARFSGIERSAALAEPGVVAVLTAADIPGTNDIGNLFRGEPLLAVEEVHCVGEPYALVVADSADAAWRGARKLSADWQPLPAIFDVRAAYAADQLIQPPRTFALGDVDAAWADCATIVSGRVELGSAEHVYMETQCALAIPRDDGGLKIHAATQSPSGVHKAVAAISGLPMHLVDVEVERLGGGFGGKEEQATPWACLAALAALRLRRPVRLQLDRPDDMRLTGKRHPYSADYRLGLDAQGISWPTRPCSTRTPAAPPTCPRPFSNARCSTPPTPTACPTSASPPPVAAPTCRRIRPSAALAHRRRCSSSKPPSAGPRGNWASRRKACNGRICCAWGCLSLRHDGRRRPGDRQLGTN